MRNKKSVNKDNLNCLIIGSTFFGTGGGGSPVEAREIFESVFEIKTRIELHSIDSFAEDLYFISAFGIGSAGVRSNPEQGIRNSIACLEKLHERPIAGVIPVEIGPKALAMAFYLAAILDLPVVDADIVGGRSTPEVFLETITLYNLQRTPAVLSNASGDLAVLLNSSSAMQEEVFMRNFARQSNGQAFVVGYSLSTTNIKQAVELGTISRTLQAGEMLLQKNLGSILESFDAQILFEGQISEINSDPDIGFLTLKLKITNHDNSADLYIKNENLILWINKELVLTCPDLIIILNSQTLEPIYNLELKIGLSVIILGLPALPKWRSNAGQALFNPKAFGFDFQVKLLGKQRS